MSKTPDNRTTSPMEHTVERHVPLAVRRIALAQTAEDRTVPELEEEAAAVGIPLDGATTKDAKAERVRNHVRGS